MHGKICIDDLTWIESKSAIVAFLFPAGAAEEEDFINIGFTLLLVMPDSTS
jgi:hypothetical protein